MCKLADDLSTKLAKLRIAVGRFGEMDRQRWWNTKGMLANVGKLALSRGFPKTQVFARARAVFAVARARSEEIFNPPDSYTLWHLPPEIEDQFEDAWAGWLESPAEWEEYLDQVEAQDDGIVLGALDELGLASEAVIERANRLRRADDLRSVPIKLNGESAEDAISLLAAAHCFCEKAKLSVPYVRQEEFPA